VACWAIAPPAWRTSMPWRIASSGAALPVKVRATIMLDAASL
jgi:hypothetical protein